ncbi:MAG: radical SAM family heme chaperone HemW [Aquificaceae bacterium]|nr:radical SAM family heme chaperone HemW [Aquificaceae bacterium]
MVKGLYFHIPFCSHKCPYCDFLSIVAPDANHGEYLSLLLKELELYQDLEFDLRSIYLGGGTPSIVRPELYADFFERLSKHVNLSGVREISLECNPENYSLEDFRLLKMLGFNRISLGVQSLREEGLKALGRLHGVEDCLKSLDRAQRAGFDNINIDLIYGYQGQSFQELQRELDMLASLPVTHVSFYLLTPYEDTVFGRLYQKGLLELPADEVIASMYQLIGERLEDMGFVHYEVSNFALAGYECLHNMLYWTHEEFLGLGASAWSFIEGVRFGNSKSLKVYTQKVMSGQKPVAYQEKLEGKESLYDYIFVALRTRRGVEKSLIGEVPEGLEDFFEVEGDRFRLNRRGMLLINEVLLRLMDAILKPC